MKQELKTINDWILVYLGLEMTQKLLDEIVTKVFEQKQKYLGYKTLFQECAVVWITEPKSKKIISIGASLPNDLIVDEFGKMFASYHSFVATGVRIVNLKNNAGVFVNYNTIGSGFVFQRMINCSRIFASASFCGSSFQVGQGTTPPTRQDFNIETPFVGIPQSQITNPSSQSVYNSGLGRITQSVSIGATTGAGVISETVDFMRIKDFTSTVPPQVVMFAHDAISPAVPFSIGKFINVAYTIQL